ncbi:MAG: CHAD domain-containing protein [Acidobacteriota bacterium]|nr:CHAD domain-containing protein [Acidobacteriota bacterium]
MPHLALPARLLRQRLLSLLDALPAATSGDVASVHRARVASRRLRAVLPVLAEAADSEALDRARKHVRRITRVLGPIRELDVALGHLEEIGPTSGATPRALARVHGHLATERTARRRAMLDVITPATLHKLKSRLAPHHPRPASDRDAEVRAARRRALRRAHVLLDEMQRAGGLYVPERLHAVRVAAKKLRYALEVERELTRSRAVARINRLKRLQDALGEVHDFEILLEHVRGVQATLAGSDLPAATELDALVRTLEEHCREGHATFLRNRAALAGLCQSIIVAAGETTAATGR